MLILKTFKRWYMSRNFENIGTDLLPRYVNKNRIRRMKKSKLNLLTNPSIVHNIDNSLCEKAKNIYPVILNSEEYKEESEYKKEFNYTIKEKDDKYNHLGFYHEKECFKKDYLKYIKHYNPNDKSTHNGFSKYILCTWAYGEESRDVKYLCMSMGKYKVTPLCETNKEILSLITRYDVHFYVEEFEGKMQPFYRIELEDEGFLKSVIMYSASLDFKKDYVFLYSLLHILGNQGYTELTFEDIRSNPLEYVKLMNLSKY